MVVSINELLTDHFCKRPRKEQLKIIAEGRPRPRLRKIVTGTDGMLKIFDDSIYDKEDWLTGCDKRDGLFCWTCVLFIEEGIQWNTSGLLDFKSLDEDILEHKNSLFHLNGMVHFHIFLKQNNSLANCISSDKIPKNTFVKNNNDALKRIIDAVCLMVSQASPPRERNSQYNLLNPADCVKLLNLIKAYDDHDVVDEAIKLVQNCPSVVENIVTVLANLVKQAVKNETKFSTFVSLILSEHSDVQAKSKLSIVVRYVRDGKISESFIGFRNTDEAKTHFAVRKHIVGVLSELEVSDDKFLGLSCDGALPSAKYLYKFFEWFRNRHPHTLYVPCHFHDFNFALQQIVLEFPECDLFFKNLESLKSFFERSPRMCRALCDFAGGGIPDLSNLQLTDSQFLRVLRIHRQNFLSFLNSLAEDTEEWSKDEIVKAICFQNVLEKFPNVFLLVTFFRLFERTAFMSEILSGNYPDSAFETGVLDGVIGDLRDDKATAFTELWTLAVAEMIDDDKSDIHKWTGEAKTQQLYQLFLKIMDRIINSIQMRFACARKLTFLGIFDCENRDKFVLSDYHLKSFVDWNSLYFDQSKLHLEMRVLVKYGWVVGRKSASELVEFLRRKNLHMTLKNLYKLAEFIVTLPCRPASPTNSSAKFDCIKAWASFSETTETDCLGLLSVEHDLLEYVKSKVQFYDEVILNLKSTSPTMFLDY